jgi:hypothetical protein
VSALRLAHNEKLRSQITRDAADECQAEPATRDLNPASQPETKNR